MLGSPAVIVVTGVQAAGKSTVARMLAERFARAVHVEADILQQMVVSGAAWPLEPGPLPAEVDRQLQLRRTHLTMLGRSFYEAGFTAVLDDIIMGEGWTQVQAALAGLPLHLVVLAPSAAVVRQRDSARAKRTLGEAWAIYLDGELRRTMTGVGLWLDSSAQSAAESINAILARFGEAKVEPR